MKLDVGGEIENASPISKEHHDAIVTELRNAGKMLAQAAAVVRQQRTLIEKLRKELADAKSGQTQIVT